MRTATAEAAVACARWVGSAVPGGDLEAGVTGIFTRAVHLQLVRRRFVLALLAPGAADAPSAIGLDAEPATALALAVGDRVALRGTLLVDAGGRALVSLAGAHRRWREPPARPDLAKPDVRRAWRTALEQLAARQQAADTALRVRALFGDAPAQDPAGRRLADHARALGVALRAGDAAAAIAASECLLGLGPGLTPAGDDLLYGILATMARTPCRDAWAAGLASRLGRTTAVGATLLACALDGAFAGGLLACARALASGQEEHVRTAMDAVCAIGHSSGMDTLTGFLYGLSIPAGAESRVYAA